MGYDLIGYILVVPAEFPEDGKRKAIERLTKLKKLAAELFAEDTMDPDFDFDEFLKPTRMEPLSNALKNLDNVEGGDWDDLLQSVILLTENPEEFVQNVDDALTDQYRSSMSRSFPGDESKTILVNAIESWGDGFDVESPGWYIERAEALGILEDLGVE